MPPSPTRHPTAGQGSLEYVGLLTLVGAVLAAAGPAVGVSGVPAQVAHVLRTGVCIVAGDVCRTADAEAAGLAPCTLSDRRSGRSGALTLLSLRVGEHHEWTVAQRSDGSVLVVRGDGKQAGASGGLGLDAGPLSVGVDGRLGVAVAHGTAWELPDAATAGRFFAELRRVPEPDPERWPPAWRSGGAGLATSGWAGLGAEIGTTTGSGGGDLLGAEVDAEALLGVRVGRGTTTYYLRTDTHGPRLGDAFGHQIGSNHAGPTVVEYTRDDRGPRELAFRSAMAGDGPGEVVDTVARMDLRVPANRAVAERLLRLRAPWPAAVVRAVREAIRHTIAVGTVERSVYAVEDASHTFAVGGRLGLELGVELGRTSVRRRLVAASAWTHGSPERAREDCLS